MVASTDCEAGIEPGWLFSLRSGWRGGFRVLAVVFGANNLVVVADDGHIALGFKDRLPSFVGIADLVSISRSLSNWSWTL